MAGTTRQPAPAPAVEADRLVIGHGTDHRDAFRLALRRLEMPVGVHTAVLGPSGCGKTSLLHALTGITRPLSGQIRFFGERLDTQHETARRRLRLTRIGMVFQSFALVEHLSALENILLPCRLGTELRATRELRARAHDLARSAGVEHTLRRRPHRLSHGERQRIAVCRALIASPELIACDEPTASLDGERASGVMDLIFREAESGGATILCVTHDRALLGRFGRVIDLATEATGVVIPGARP